MIKLNKKLKTLVALTLVMGTVAGGSFISGNNIFVSPAYASSDDADELSDIYLEDSDGDSIDLYSDSDYEDEIDDFDVGDTYYAESDTKKINIDIDGADEEYVRIFFDDEVYEAGDTIKLSSGKNTIKIRVYEDEYDEDEDYSSSDYNQYTIKVDYDDDDDESQDYTFEDSDGNSIDLYTDSDYDDELDDDIEYGETYYAESDTKKVSFSFDDIDDDYVRIFLGSKLYEPGEDIKLSSGNNTLKIRVYDDEYDEDEDYSSSDYEQYTIKVAYDSDEETTVDENNSKLSSLSLSDGNIIFNKDSLYYNVNVGSDVNSIDVQAIPEHSDSVVKINGTQVSESSSYKRNISLNDGSNNVQISVSNGDDITTYNIYVGKAAPELQNNNQIKEGWNKIDGIWYYADSSLNKMTGWQKIDNAWYYMNNSGEMQIGWKFINSKWYYLEQSGAMKTGWLLDTDGKWYYLNSSGDMALNTTVNGYKLGSDGAWIK
ncbi:MAG: cadherin-like beta sandwich domain-containing protein [Clostridium sp.]|nr:cadherin-like beta sandwich domain-containing protein [Clostridium sp.]